MGRGRDELDRVLPPLQRPVTADGLDIAVRASVFHRGQRLGVANAEVILPDGKVAAVATSSFHIVPDSSGPVG